MDVIERQAAIDAGKELCKTCDEQPNGWCGSCRMDEYLKAIEALPPTQSEPCEDAVSRKAVIEITAETGALETQYRVKRLPPVTPKQRTGKWLYYHGDDIQGFYGHPYCSECYGYAPFKADGSAAISPFCPNCGAKMEGVSE